MLVPEFINKLVDRLTQNVPTRFHRMVRLAIFAATIAFVVFELSRMAAVVTFLLPVWAVLAERVRDMATQSPLIAFVSLSVTLLAFFAPLAGLVCLAMRFQNGTLRTKRVTKTGE